MNLRNRLILIGCIFLLLQLGTLAAVFYYVFMPKFYQQENTFLEKNLHRSLEILQHELFHLGHLSELLTDAPVITEILDNPTLPSSIAHAKLHEKMLQYDINVIEILDKDNKVLFEEILDLTTQQPYLNQPFLAMLWENRPQFFKPLSLSDTEAGIYNSVLGPILLISTPIGSNNVATSFKGMLITGRLITAEMIQLIQNLSFSNTRIWPLEGAILSKKHKAILEQLLQTDSNFLVKKNSATLIGYMPLLDLKNKSTLLMSTAYPRDLEKMGHNALFLIGGLFLFFQFLFFSFLSFIIKKQLMVPADQLLRTLQIEKNKWYSFNIDNIPTRFPASTEIGALATLFVAVLSRQQIYLKQEALFNYRKELELVRSNLQQHVQEILRLILTEMAVLEKKLSNLPIHEMEEIVALARADAVCISSEEYSDHLAKLTLQSQLYQKETRVRLHALHTKILRAIARLKDEAWRTPTPAYLEKKRE